MKQPLLQIPSFKQLMNRFLPVLVHPFLHTGCILATAFLVYSNNYVHDYHLDDCHLIPDNPAVRSLKNIPSYFTDPRTLSVLPSNIDYRPILQITYALNYRISGYATWSWHLVQIILHAVCAVSLYFFILMLLRQFPAINLRYCRITAFAIAILFTVHPTGSGVVNYLSARSSLLTAALLLPSFISYMRGRYGNLPIVSVVLYTLALFTKVEAVGALPVYFLYDMLQTSQLRESSKPGNLLEDAAKTLNAVTLRRMAPYLFVTAVYFLIRFKVMAGYDTGARHDATVTPLIYFITQVTAWWYYVLNWIAPVRLVADMLTYPVFRSPFDPHVMMAAGGWLLVAYIVIVNYRKSPWLLFTVAAAWSLIAPTSTVAPLAEMVNEHRPYLPMAVFSGGWFMWLFTSALTRTPHRWSISIAGVCGVALVVLSFFLLTRQRNIVFSTAEKYYEDILRKAPSSRAYANYGLLFMRKGRYEEAKSFYEKSLELGPNYYIALTNLGIIYQHLGLPVQARIYFDRAVTTDLFSATARIYRGEFLLSKSEFKQALEDFETVLPLYRSKYRICKNAATAAAGLGNWEKAADYLKCCVHEDASAAELSIVDISRPFWTDSTRYGAGLHFYLAVDTLYPGRWWVHHNLGDLAQRCGDTVRSEREFSLARSLKAIAAAPLRKR